MTRLLARLTGRRIERIRFLINRYPNTGPYKADWFWRTVLCPISTRLYLEQQRRERISVFQSYDDYYKRLRRGQMLFRGPTGIPRSRSF